MNVQWKQTVAECYDVRCPLIWLCTLPLRINSILNLMRCLHQLSAFVIFSHFMLCNRKHMTKVTSELLMFSVSKRYRFTWTTRDCFVFSHFISTELKPLQAVSSCQFLSHRGSGTCPEVPGEQNWLVEKSGLVPAGFPTATGTVPWCVQLMYRCYTGSTDIFLWAYFLKPVVQRVDLSRIHISVCVACNLKR